VRNELFKGSGAPSSTRDAAHERPGTASRHEDACSAESASSSLVAALRIHRSRKGRQPLSSLCGKAIQPPFSPTTATVVVERRSACRPSALLTPNLDTCELPRALQARSPTGDPPEARARRFSSIQIRYPMRYFPSSCRPLMVARVRAGSCPQLMAHLE